MTIGPEIEAVKKPSEFPSCKIKTLPYARGMSQENTFSEQPLIRHVNRQQMSWQAVDVEKLIGEDHSARAVWMLAGRIEVPDCLFRPHSPFHTADSAVRVLGDAEAAFIWLEDRLW